MQLNWKSLQGPMGDKPLFGVQGHQVCKAKHTPGFSMAETKSSLVGLLGPRPISRSDASGLSVPQHGIPADAAFNP